MNVTQWLQSLWSWIVWLRNRLTTDETRISALEGKVKAMADVLDQVKADFESYKSTVDSKFAELQQKIADLLAGQLDPAKAQAIDDEINAARAALNPPAP